MDHIENSYPPKYKDESKPKTNKLIEMSYGYYRKAKTSPYHRHNRKVYDHNSPEALTLIRAIHTTLRR